MLVSSKRCKLLWWICFIHESSRFSCSFLKLVFVSKSVCGPWYLSSYALFVWYKKGFAGLIGPSILLLMFSSLWSDNSWSEKTLVQFSILLSLLSSCVKSKNASETILRFIAFSIYVCKQKTKNLQSIHFISDDLKFYFSPWQVQLSSHSSFLFFSVIEIQH